MKETPRQSRFSDLRFGMFIHLGFTDLVLSGTGVMHRESIPVAEYEKLAPQFNPVKFNAEEWVSIRRCWTEVYRHHQPPSRWL